jgi:hypothetical protein
MQIADSNVTDANAIGAGERSSSTHAVIFEFLRIT